MMANQSIMPNYQPQQVIQHPYYQPSQFMGNFSQVSQVSQGPSFSQVHAYNQPHNAGISQINNGPMLSQVASPPVDKKEAL